MKSKLTKILLVVLTCVMLFGALVPSAYESYDTYTYSIDGEPLKSPAAYTPSPNTYDSQSMGLLAGNYWRYDNYGKVALWEGDMTPKSLDVKFSSQYIDFQPNGEDTCTAVGIIHGVDNANLEKLGSAIVIPEIYVNPDTLEEFKVTKIADDFLYYDGEDEDVINAYSAVTTVIIGKNVSEIGKKAFLSTSIENGTVYYEASSTAWEKIKGAKDVAVINPKNISYYSADIKYGNTVLNGNDIVADGDGNLYVVDRENNRVVVLDRYQYNVIGVMRTWTDEFGKTQTFNKPTGVYVTDENKMVDGSSHIFVCDTDNRRIVVFNKNYEYERTITEPASALLDEDDFTPYAIAVDIYGRIFIVSRNCYQGVIVLSNDGDFTGFIGAQQVTVDVIQQIWEKINPTKENEKTSLNLSIPFNNITVDDQGFVYVTINFTDKANQKNQLAAIKEKTATYSPVKKLNSTGVEIMNRNGFFDPGGEVAVLNPGDVSNIIDVAIGDEKSWTILDTKRMRTFTYDRNGNLLFAFGDEGDQIGNGEDLVAMTYQVVTDEDGEKTYNLVLLDRTETGDKISVYHPTHYCDQIMSALYNENNHNYSATIDDWREVLTSNNNFDLAYIGIGKALYNQGKYKEAMEMLGTAYETEYYSKAFAEVRKDIISVWMIPMIVLIIVALFLFAKFLGWAKKKNKATSLKVGRKTYLEELLYAFHLVFHPFDGFWDLKHEKRGSVRAGTTILGITIVAFFYQAIGQGYLFNPRGDYSTVILQVLAVLVPVLLWIVANWCLTTLFDGEGSFKDIYIATCYSLAPLPLFIILSTILSNVFTSTEGAMVTLLVAIGYIWVGLLLFFGMAVTHDYTNGKNVITTLGTIAAMAIIMFLAILFSSLVVKMVTFIISIISEIGNRI